MEIFFLLNLAAVSLIAVAWIARRGKRTAERTPLAPPATLAEKHRRLERCAADTTSAQAARALADSFGQLQQMELPQGTDATGAMVWLDDNAFYLRQQAVQLAREFTARRSERLPLKGKGLRVAQVAKTVLDQCQGPLKRQSLVEILVSLQRRGTLCMDEIWALPLYLRLALLEQAAQSAQDTERTRATWDMAQQACDRLMGQPPNQVRAILEELRPLDRPGENTIFVESLSRQLMEQGGQTHHALLALDKLLERRGCLLEDLVLEEHRRQAEEDSRISAVMNSLWFLDRQLWLEIFEESSRVEQLLRQDPGGVYASMDEASRKSYRQQVRTLSRRWGIQEGYLCRRALECARRGRHPGDEIGWYLLDPEGVEQLAQRVHHRMQPMTCRDKLMRWQAPPMLLALLLAAELGLILSRLAPWPAALAIALLLWPTLYFWVRQQVEKGLTQNEPVMPLPRLALAEGIPARGKTCVVVTALVSTPEKCRALFSRLEAFYLGNREQHTVFALLADLPQADAVTAQGDDAILQAGLDAARRLNERWGSHRFVFLLRSRRELEGKWTGWERKRGALLMLNNLIAHGQSGDFLEAAQAYPALKNVAYVLTLDADTILLPGTLRPLVGTMMHPLHQPVVQRGRVVSGYGLIQPRLRVTAQDAGASSFARQMNGIGGVEPYMTAGYDFYQKFFHRAIFTGKGIYSVKAYDEVLATAIEENRVLSHDLLEGSFLRAGLASDITLMDGCPATVHGYFSRLHRWIRGDWQLIPYMGKDIPTQKGARRNPLPALCRWQMADNLARSLRAPAMLAAMMLAAFAGGLGLLLAVMTIAALLEGLGQSLRQWARGEGRGMPLWEAAGRAGRGLLLLPIESYISLDAVCRTLGRLRSRRRMLQWTTAADAELGAPDRWWKAYRRWRGAAVTGLVVLAAGWISGQLIGSAILGLCWILAPLWAYRVSLPRRRSEPEALSESQLLDVRLIARRTYHYFERFVEPAHGYLPPDNVQLDPFKGVAARTSPTNMGLAMVSLVTGWFMGYSAIDTVLQKLEGMLQTMESMEKWKGHWFNWYDTVTGAPLPPRYISSVDSGNLLACLWMTDALLQRALETGPSLPGQVQGWADTWALHCIRRKVPEDTLSAQLRAANAAERMPELARRLQRALKGEKEGWGGLLAAQLEALDKAGLLQKNAAWSDTTRERITRLRGQIKGACRMDLTALYDKKRGLFLIGLDPDAPAAEQGACYDLMASEARILSLVAIARGDVPAEHWRRLARPVALAGDGISLWSWSGTMFEYLLPTLFFAHKPGTLLGDMVEGAVTEQMARGAATGRPWGVSEAGYYEFDLNMQYQYRAFGIPQLGMKSGLEQDQVVAPYATLMAYPFAPLESWRNMRRLMDLDALGDYGFFEAVDFTSARIEPGASYKLVSSYMVHHQGMGFLSVSSALQGGLLQECFGSIPQVRAIQPLLEEMTATRDQAIDRSSPAAKGGRRAKLPRRELRQARHYENSQGLWPPQGHLLSNGRYHVMLNASGCGFSRCRQIAVSRWRDDVYRTEYGWNFYLKQDALPQARRLFPLEADSRTPSKTVFEPHRAMFTTQAEHIQATLEVYVDGQYDGELRRMTLENTGTRPETVTLYSYLELALQQQQADEAHPGFHNLFVQTDADPNQRLLTAQRRRRSQQEEPVACALQVQAAETVRFSCDTSREHALGRGRSAAHPALLEKGLSGTAGGVLDPCLATGVELTLAPGERVVLRYALAVGESADTAAGAAKSMLLRDGLDMAWAREQAVLSYLGIRPNQLTFFHALLPFALYARPVQRSVAKARLKNDQKESILWPLGLSREAPILLMELSDAAHAEQVLHLVKAHAWLRIHGVETTLVILYRDHGDYHRTLREQLYQAILSGPDRERMDRAGGVYLIDQDQCDGRQLDALRAAARVALKAGSTMTYQLQSDEKACVLRPAAVPQQGPGSLPQEAQLYPNGFGGFTPGNYDYTIQNQGTRSTPMPWSHVMANDRFGALVTASGGGYLWYGNSQMGKLTPWFNDPLRDPSAQLLLLRDTGSGEVFTPWDQLWTAPCRRQTRYGLGYVVAEAAYEEMTLKLEQFVPDDSVAVQVSCLTVQNQTLRSRTLELTHAVRWVLGDRYGGNGAQLRVCRAQDPRVLWVENPLEQGFEGIAFHAIAQGMEAASCDEGRVWGLGAMDKPPAAALAGDLDADFEEGCGGITAIRRRLTVQPGGTVRCLLLLGCLKQREELPDIMARWGLTEPFDQRLSAVRQAWEQRLAGFQAATPSQPMDIFINRWLPYQALASRFLARTGYYQAGGAYGFRDQLQDCLALIWVAPELVREHLLRAAAHQFAEGDVQHWWHEPNQGIRTRISDDRLFLPYVTYAYVAHTGDDSVLKVEVPFLSAPLLEAEQEDSYGAAEPSAGQASLLEHCLRAVDYSLARFGEHGLPLMGGGDWNDAMNLVGIKGRGESVWLGFFLADVLDKSIELAQWAGETERTAGYPKRLEQLRRDLEQAGWDGAWYRRAYNDEGRPLGSRESDACRIDCLSQAWAVLSGVAPPDRAQAALNAALGELWDREAGILALLTPPFGQEGDAAGYIQGYLPGIRENGGQYTHGAAWMAAALAKAGRGEEAEALWNQLLPLSHSMTPADAQLYQGEPYAVAADIYTHPQHKGRAGWTWYTGSAAWLYVVALEHILGIRVRRGTLTVSPCIPPSWDGFTIRLPVKDSYVTITVENPHHVAQGVKLQEVDGRAVSPGPMGLAPSPRQVRIIMG